MRLPADQRRFQQAMLVVPTLATPEAEAIPVEMIHHYWRFLPDLETRLG